MDRLHDFFQPPKRLVKGMDGDAEALRKLLAVVGAARKHQHSQELDFFIKALFRHGNTPFPLNRPFSFYQTAKNGQNGKVSLMS